MSETKLTKAQKRALTFYAANDGAKYHPSTIAGATIRRLVAIGLLRSERPNFGMVRHFVTQAGSDALDALAKPASPEVRS